MEVVMGVTAATVAGTVVGAVTACSIGRAATAATVVVTAAGVAVMAATAAPMGLRQPLHQLRPPL